MDFEILKIRQHPELKNKASRVVQREVGHTCFRILVEHGRLHTVCRGSSSVVHRALRQCHSRRLRRHRK